MRKLAILLVTVVTLVTPTAAQAYGTNLHKYGVGVSGNVGQCLTITYNEVVHAANYSNNWTVRCAFDAKTGQGNVFNTYAGTVDWLVASGITILPIITWTNSDGTGHHTSGSGEEGALTQFASDVLGMLNYVHYLRGATFSNVVEVWNEPNCTSTSKPCTYSGYSSLGDFKDHAFNQISWGARVADSDVNLILGGLCYGTTGTNGCEDAADWIQTWENNNYKLVSGYAIHPYGKTNATTHKRETTVPTVTKATAEVIRAQNAANTGDNHPVLITESGFPSDPYGDGSEGNWLTYQMGGFGNSVPLIVNWISVDQGSGDGSKGVYYTNDAPKPVSCQVWCNTDDSFVGTLPDPTP